VHRRRREAPPSRRESDVLAREEGALRCGLPSGKSRELSPRRDPASFGHHRRECRAPRTRHRQIACEPGGLPRRFPAQQGRAHGEHLRALRGVAQRAAAARAHPRARQPRQEGGPFILNHEPGASRGGYALAGHIHPAVRLSASGESSLRLPCFWFGARYGVLPAFGAFTGSAEVLPRKGDQVFVIAEHEVMKVT
jgi:hypothetical protein